MKSIIYYDSNGTRFYVASFSANSETFATVWTADATEAFAFDADYAYRLSLFLSTRNAVVKVHQVA